MSKPSEGCCQWQRAARQTDLSSEIDLTRFDCGSCFPWDTTKLTDPVQRDADFGNNCRVHSCCRISLLDGNPVSFYCSYVLEDFLKELKSTIVLHTLGQHLL